MDIHNARIRKMYLTAIFTSPLSVLPNKCHNTVNVLKVQGITAVSEFLTTEGTEAQGLLQ